MSLFVVVVVVVVVVSDNQLLLFLCAPTNLLVLTDCMCLGWLSCCAVLVLVFVLLETHRLLVQWPEISEPHCPLANLSAVRSLCRVTQAQGCGGSHLHFRWHTIRGTRTIPSTSVRSVDAPLEASSSNQNWLLFIGSCRFPQLL
jgi:hypothetical protein